MNINCAMVVMKNKLAMIILMVIIYRLKELNLQKLLNLTVNNISSRDIYNIWIITYLSHHIITSSQAASKLIRKLGTLFS